VGEDTRQIEREIRETRSDLGRNLKELEGRARELADWRTHYRKHPGAFLGVAAGIGVGLGFLAIRSRRRGDAGSSFYDNSHDPMRPPRSRNAVMMGATETGARAARQFGDTWNQLADGLLRLASDKAIAFVAELVPGLRDHLDRPPTRSATYPSSGARH
jgi:hypothetical protein